jgi:hypothetical protein
MMPYIPAYYLSCPRLNDDFHFCKKCDNLLVSEVGGLRKYAEDPPCLINNVERATCEATDDHLKTTTYPAR